MPYLTPETVPDTQMCRALLIPDSAEWLAIFSGALTELTLRWNWEQQGISVDDAIAVAVDVIDNYYNGCVSTCEQPGGYAVLRLSIDGHVEQLIDGDYVTPTGDYEIPPVPAREEPTADERRCLAAANAANVLEELYEVVSDAAAANLSVADLAVLIIDFFAVRFFWLAPIINGFLILLVGALNIVLAVAHYITADLWDEGFTNDLRCILYDCASDDAGVVTFDWGCVQESLTVTLGDAIVDEEHARLMAQIAALLAILGGVDALNHAATTTDITSASCFGCDNDCGLLITFEPEQAWQVVAFGYGASGFVAAYDDDFGDPLPSLRTGSGTDSSSLPGMGLAVEIDLGAPTSITGLEFRYWYTRNDLDLLYIQIDWLNSSHSLITTSVITPSESQAAWHGAIFTDDVAAVQYVQIRVAGSGGGFVDGDAWIDNVCVNPSG